MRIYYTLTVALGMMILSMTNVLAQTLEKRIKSMENDIKYLQKDTSEIKAALDKLLSQGVPKRTISEDSKITSTDNGCTLDILSYADDSLIGKTSLSEKKVVKNI